MYNSIWYQNLTKPPFSPPNTVFSIVWTFLYITIFLSLFLYTIKIGGNKKAGYICYFIQLFLNFIWPFAFFGLKNIPLALIVVFLMDIFVFLTIYNFYFVSKISAILLIPYFLWILFASYLNFGYLVLN